MGESHFALCQVVTRRFAGLGAVRIIQDIVPNLKGDAYVSAHGVEAQHSFVVRTGYFAAQHCGNLKQ